MAFTDTKTANVDIIRAADWNAFVDYAENISSNVLTWHDISGLKDVAPSSPTAGQTLAWRTSVSKWVPSTLAVAGVSNLSDLSINANKGWAGYGITGMSHLSSQTISGGAIKTDRLTITQGTDGIQFVDASTKIYESSDDLNIDADDDILLNPDDDVVISINGTNWVRFDGDNKSIYIDSAGVKGSIQDPDYNLEVGGSFYATTISGTKVSSGTIIGNAATFKSRISTQTGIYVDFVSGNSTNLSVTQGGTLSSDLDGDSYTYGADNFKFVSSQAVSGGTIIGTWAGDEITSAYITDYIASSTAKSVFAHSSNINARFPGSSNVNKTYLGNVSSNATNAYNYTSASGNVLGYYKASAQKYNQAYESGQNAMYNITHANDLDDGAGGGWDSVAFNNSGIKWDGDNWVPMPSGGSGGGGTPGGTNVGDIQYRQDATTFDGETNFNYSADTDSLRVYHISSKTISSQTIFVGTTAITDILDEDDMSSDSATSLATQQSIKAYVDTLDTEYTAFSSNARGMFAHSSNINSRFVASGIRLLSISSQNISGGSIRGHWIGVSGSEWSRAFASANATQQLAYKKGEQIDGDSLNWNTVTEELDVQDVFVKNNDDDTMGGVLTADGFKTTGYVSGGAISGGVIKGDIHGTYDYNIYKIGSDYYGKKMSDGSIVESNSTIETVLNAVAADMTGDSNAYGNTIGFAGGTTYTFNNDSPVTFTDRQVYIDGGYAEFDISNCDSTVFCWRSDGWGNHMHCGIQNVHLKGGGDRTKTNQIFANFSSATAYVTNVTTRNVGITRSVYNPIRVNDDAVHTSIRDCYLMGVYPIRFMGGVGVAGEVSRAIIDHCHLGNYAQQPAEIAIEIQGCQNTSVINTHFTKVSSCISGGTGTGGDQSDMRIQNCGFTGYSGQAINIDSVRAVISDNIFKSTYSSNNDITLRNSYGGNIENNVFYVDADKVTNILMNNASRVTIDGNMVNIANHHSGCSFIHQDDVNEGGGNYSNWITVSNNHIMSNKPQSGTCIIFEDVKNSWIHDNLIGCMDPDGSVSTGMKPWHTATNEDANYSIGTERNVIADNFISTNSACTALMGQTIAAWSDGGGFTITLPTLPTYRGEKTAITVKNRGSNTITLNTPGQETIDGNAQYKIDNENGYVRIIHDGYDWMIVASGQGQ